MSIKVVCVTKVDGLLTRNVILEKATTPENLIQVADRFIPLAREHGIANGQNFDGIECLIDERPVQFRFLVEQVATAFYLLKTQLYGSAGYAMLKHESEAKRFLDVVLAGNLPTYLVPPKWRGHRPKPSQMQRADEAALQSAIKKQRGKGSGQLEQSIAPDADSVPVASSQPSLVQVETTEASSQRKRRKLTGANLGLGMQSFRD
ncbi:hypothetical protein SJI00_20975 [Pseudomonas sp. RP23018S]|uniref:hypothetical protein n=1 Tax=Pseudomonas sp. RP23018S TaxID=3096037 RepID=UPI002ACA86D1|nr:hypothetical protein [Pseudomonas sp. RP23018S]MDZ5605250.1 hypothetical protein [Pseudomonas sp. RP23018S]